MIEAAKEKASAAKLKRKRSTAPNNLRQGRTVGQRAVVLFNKEHRPRVMEELLPGAQLKLANSRLGELWRAMGDAERRQYVERAEAEVAAANCGGGGAQ